MTLDIALISLFPAMFSTLAESITGIAQRNQQLNLHFYNPRDFTDDPYGAVDDRPYGGGPGMVLQAQPLLAVIYRVKQQFPNTPVIYLSPQGQTLKQSKVFELSQRKSLILLCGRYEGIDQRVIDTVVDEQLSIGDYVLSGGELAAMVLIDAMTRLLPGVLGDEQSAAQDSFSDGLLEYPHYTRPQEIAGISVPTMLLSGNHSAIARWRKKQALGTTWLKRPDLIEKQSLTSEQQVLLNEFIDENK